MRRDTDALGYTTTRVGADGIAAVLADPANALIASDFDGTLAPIVTDPSEAGPAPGALEALSAVAARVGQVAVVTGRPAQVAVDLGGLGVVPGIVVLGLYGAERWQDGTLTPAAPPPRLADAYAAAARLISAHPGVTLEDKVATFAVHTRRAPDPDTALAELLPDLVSLASAYGLHVARGRLALELHGLDLDKGSALDALATESSARSIVFSGDDVGDLAAFATVRRRRDAGTPGVTVAAASSEAPAVAEDADLVVEGPAGVVDFLRRLTQAI